jgi:hypothetical protein
MQNKSGARIDRRWFLRFGLLAHAVAVVGCDAGEQVQTVDSPPAKGGNRSRLEARKPKTAESESAVDKKN